MYHILEFPRPDDHVDRLGLEKTKRFAVFPVTIFLDFKDNGFEHNNIGNK